MMMYEFKCSDCQKDFDVDIHMADYDDFKKNGTCPDCGGKNIERVYTAPSVKLNGCGFGVSQNINSWASN